MREITPPDFRCGAEDECPSVFEDGEDLVIVGVIEGEPHELVSKKIGYGEAAVRINRELIAGLIPYLLHR